MGIPRLFFHLLNNYPEALIQLKEYQKFSNLNNLEIDTYLLDLNAIIHPVCQEIYGYGGKPENGLLKRSKSTPPTEKQVYNAVCRKIEELRRIVNPRKKLVIAIDGIPGCGKILQQRSRRFKASLERDPNQVFDSSKITTGTEFMSGLSRYIHIFIKRQIEGNYWEDLEVVFSNERVVGEGEHNLLDFIRRDSTSKNFCIHSPDADLIMLALPLEKPSYILRENIYNNIHCKYFIINVQKYKSVLLSQLRWCSLEHSYTSTQCTWDFILICFLLGNDFLPHIPSLEISNDGLETLLYAYPRVAMEHGHFVYRNSENKLSLNTNSLKEFFYSLSLKEGEALLRKAGDKSINFPDKLLQDATFFNTKTEQKDIDMEKYKHSYYRQRLHNARPEDVSTEYLKGMVFVIRYYIDGIPDWHWFYPYHYAPLFSDLYEYIPSFNGEMKFTINSPLTAYEQLLAVLPPKSAEILPEPCRELMLSGDSDIADFYPTEFKIDLEGKRQEWEGHAILPFIDVKRLKKAFQKIEARLSEQDKRRVAFGKTMRYNWVGESVKVTLL